MSKGKKETFYVVEYTDMPEHFHQILCECDNFRNDIYMKWLSWGNTREGCCEGHIEIEEWIESQIPELNDFRKKLEGSCEPKHTVLIHVCW